MINDYIGKLLLTLETLNHDAVNDIARVLMKCHDDGGRIFVFGNGGSGATASHFAQDMNKMLGYRFICLNDNMPSVLAYGNDMGFETIFKEQLSRLIKSGDIVMGISGSGNSPNVVNAIAYADKRSCLTVGLVGFTGGEVLDLVDYGVHVKSDDMQICEDCHMIITHLIMKIIQSWTKGATGH